MSHPNLEQTLQSLRDLRQRDRTRDLSDYIEELLLKPWSNDDARALRGELLRELQLHHRHADAEALLLSEVDREPGEPFHSLCLAEHFHYYDVDLHKSSEHIAQAIAKADVDGKFMYQALAVQARLAIELENWSLLEQTLQRLATYEHIPGNVDVFPETDFISRIPPGVVSDSGISAYARRVEYLRSVGYSTLHGPRGGNAA